MAFGLSNTLLPRTLGTGQAFAKEEKKASGMVFVKAFGTVAVMGQITFSPKDGRREQLKLQTGLNRSPG